MTPTPACDKYLRTRAIRGPWQIQGDLAETYRAAVVIPALDERESLPLTLATLACNPLEMLRQALVVVVVNNRADATDAEKGANRKTLDWLATNPYPDLQIGRVDASSPGCALAAQDGVGLARKIGFDLALSVLDWAQDPFLVSLDADTLIDDNYLSALFAHFDSRASVGGFLPYRHQDADSPIAETAIRRYELYLRSYQLGLELAGSPYAFTAIGSAIACRASAYVACGGMKRRQAGEDFYFLQQLAKQGLVEAIRGTLVRPSARFSRRVPFGTGRAVEVQANAGRSLYRFITRSSFERLKKWQEQVSDCRDRPAEDLLGWARGHDSELAAFLHERDFSIHWEKLQRTTPPARFMAAWHNWFDGLRTRQLLHRYEACVPEPEIGPLVAELLEAAGLEKLSDPSAQLRLLEALQHVPPSSKEVP